MPRLSLRRLLLSGSAAVAVSCLAPAVLPALVPAAHALSELRPLPGQPADAAAGETDGEDATEESVPLQIPDPDPLIRRDEAAPATGDETDGASDGTPTAEPEVIYDIAKAPEAVRRMRELIVEAAASGDIERLRPLLGTGPTRTQVSLVESDEDPVVQLKSFSGDAEGAEILAILLDVLATGFARVDPGTPDEMYVWPYFAEKSLANLSPPEKVELLRIVTAGDFADMQEFGGYNFYRLGISPDGQWKMFLAGE
ncbi:hypothetical protein LXM94_16370 [Rhizobium sp. TRM95111]|uniref:hypothetical protein n=1 Tax=Rhizobium alarense TaxID=2846851 RepID=UPI001F23D5CA|nr:hypothetical protein [Rhizobium alarense]MCF3641549.1 hypothetical protein [Rhizobium alarense]